MHSDPTRAWKARLSDGKSAAASHVDVRLTERGIAITQFAGTSAPLIWPYGALATAAPIGAHSEDLLVSYKYQPDATLYVHGADFATALGQRAHHLTARSQRLRHAAPWLWAAVIVLLVGAGVRILQLSPARAIAGLIPDKTRVALGEQVVKSMVANRKVCEAPAGKAALEKLVTRLSAAAGGKTPFKVVVVDWGLVNAFAAPGEQIVVTRGLVTKATTSDEVAGVLAHEMGHGIELHPESGLVRAIGMSAAVDLIMGGGAGTVANLGVLLAQLSYTRAAEREADDHSFRILKGAGIGPKGIADFFGRLEKTEDDDDNGKDKKNEPAKGKEDGKPTDSRPKRKGWSGADVFNTHPQTAERARLAESQPPYPSTPALSIADWQALRDICGPPKQ